MTKDHQTNTPENSHEASNEQWDRVRSRLRAEFGNAAYKSWLQPISLTEVDSGRVTMQVPTRFIQEWVMSRYADRIRALWRGEDSSISSIHIAVSAGPGAGEQYGDAKQAHAGDSTGFR